MRFITHSESGTARRCWRKWYLSYYRRLDHKAARLNDNTLLGDLVHDSLAEFYDEGQDPLAAIIHKSGMIIQHQEDMLMEGVGEESRAVIERNIATVEEARDFATIIIQGYLEWLEETGEDQHLEHLGSEQEVSVIMPVKSWGTDVALLAKLDSRFMDHRTGARVFMDHKTVQNFADREKYAHLDTQFYFYSLIDYLVALVEDEENPQWTDGGILNMLRKVKRTARSNPPFYKRKPVRHSIIELQNYFARLTGEITDILQKSEMLDNGMDHHLVCPPNPTRDCSWDCSFMTLCAFMDDGSDVEGYIEASFDVVNPIQRYKSVTALEVEVE